MGDFNFNLLNSNDKLIENFLDIMFDHGYYSLISKPTRITTKSTGSKTIDHIWTNAKCSEQILSLIITFQIADHLAVMQSSALGKYSIKPLLSNKVINETYLEESYQTLNSADFSGVLLKTDTNDSFTTFFDIINLARENKNRYYK